MADPSHPTVAVLLYRKHVITEQMYIGQLIRSLEEQGVRPIPIFINGIEAHTVVGLPSFHGTVNAHDNSSYRWEFQQLRMEISAATLGNLSSYLLCYRPPITIV